MRMNIPDDQRLCHFSFAIKKAQEEDFFNKVAHLNW